MGAGAWALLLHWAELLPAASGGSPGSLPAVRKSSCVAAWPVAKRAVAAEGAEGADDVPLLLFFFPPFPLLPLATLTPARPWCSTLPTAAISSHCWSTPSSGAGPILTFAGWIWGRRR